MKNKRFVRRAGSLVLCLVLVAIFAVSSGVPALGSNELLEEIAQAESLDQVAELTEEAFQRFLETYPHRLGRSINPETILGCVGGGCLKPCSGGICRGSREEKGFLVVAPFETMRFSRSGAPIAFIVTAHPEGRTGFFLVSLDNDGENVSFINQHGETVSRVGIALHSGDERISVTPIPIPDPSRISLNVNNPRASIIEGRETSSIWIGKRAENGLYYGVNLVSVTPIPIP